MAQLEVVNRIRLKNAEIRTHTSRVTKHECYLCAMASHLNVTIKCTKAHQNCTEEKVSYYPAPIL